MRAKRGTKKNSVVLREKQLNNGNISLYLDTYREGQRSYEFLKLYLIRARTPLERQTNKETMALAEQIRTERERELNHSQHGIVSPSKKKVSFFRFTDNYIATYQKKDIKMIKGAVKRFRDFLTEERPRVNQKTLNIGQLDKVMMLDFIEYLDSRSTGEGAHSYYQRFKKILRRALDEGLINRMPTDGVALEPKDKDLRKDVLTNEEIARIAKTECQNGEIKRAFLFCCVTGLRWCDVNELTFKSVDLKAERMTIKQLKTEKGVTVDLNGTALKLIGEQQDPDNKVFALPSQTACNKTLKALVRRAGINKHITWHCARHSFAVNLLTIKGDNKPDIKTVSATLGHTSLKHTEKYTRLIDEVRKSAINSLPDYL